MTNGEVIKSEHKVAIPFLLYKIPSINDKISYTLVSLIRNGGDSLDGGNCVSDVFGANTGIWWHCDDANITEISAFRKGFILEIVSN